MTSEAYRRRAPWCAMGWVERGSRWHSPSLNRLQVPANSRSSGCSECAQRKHADLLRLAVFENFKIILLQVIDKFACAISHHGAHLNQIRVGANHVILFRLGGSLPAEIDR